MMPGSFPFRLLRLTAPGKNPGRIRVSRIALVAMAGMSGGSLRTLHRTTMSSRGLSPGPMVPQFRTAMERPMLSYFVYILASRPYGTLYIGVTNGLIRRIDEHRAGTASKFTRRYKAHTLV